MGLTANVLWCSVLIPVVFQGLLLVAQQIPSPIRPSAERPLVLIFPFIGVSLLPAVVLVWRTLGKLKVFKTLLAVPTFLWFIHCLLTWVYGNANNDAYSDSWQIDVSAPISYWNQIANIDPSFRLSHNASTWSEAIAGPHLDQFKCNGHIFVRFMCHRILQESRVSLLLARNVTFCGSWMMVERADGVGKAKVFTDFAYGDDALFNNLIRYVIVDTRNMYQEFNNTLDDASMTWDIQHTDFSPMYKGIYRASMQGTGKTFPPGGRNHVQDQYSCMNEALWLRSLTGNGWCFMKMMKASADLEIKGTLIHPLLKAPLSFPTGDSNDCSKPVVRGVFSKHLHWVRDNYLC